LRYVASAGYSLALWIQDYVKKELTMAKKGFISNKLKPWIDARKKYQLSHAQVQMARELGLNPKKLSGMANHKQES